MTKRGSRSGTGRSPPVDPMSSASNTGYRDAIVGSRAVAPVEIGDSRTVLDEFAVHGRRLPVVKDPGGGAADHPDVLVTGGLQQLRMQTGDVAAEPLHQVAGHHDSGRCVSTPVG